MLLSRLAATRTALTATRSRNAKRDLIAEVLRDASADDVEIVVSLPVRRPAPAAHRRGLADPAARAAAGRRAVADGGRGRRGLRRHGRAERPGIEQRPGPTRCADLFARATAEEQQFLFGLVSGELRQGAMEAAVQDGLAVAFGVPLAAVRRAAMLLSSTTAAAAVLLRRRPAGAGGGRTAGRAPGSSRCSPPAHPTPAAAVAKTGLPVLVDHKLDGVRVQVHRDGDAVRIFTRSLDDITARLPEVAEAVRALPQTRLVLDGEVLALGADGRPEVFQVVASRTMSEVDPAGPAPDNPLRVFFFDLLHVDGRDLLDTPLQDRLTVMRDVLPAALTVPRQVCATEEEVGGAVLRRRGRRLRGRGDQEPGRPVRRRPAGRRLGQDQAAAHLRPGRHRGRVGTRPAAGLAVQPAPRRAAIRRPASWSCWARPSRA